MQRFFLATVLTDETCVQSRSCNSQDAISVMTCSRLNKHGYFFQVKKLSPTELLSTLKNNIPNYQCIYLCISFPITFM